MSDVNSFITKLLKQVPSFQSVYDEHLEFYGELLPHVLLGELADYLSDAYRNGHFPTARDIVAIINHAVAFSGKELQGILRVSFLIHLPELYGYYEYFSLALNDQALRLIEQEN